MNYGWFHLLAFSGYLLVLPFRRQENKILKTLPATGSDDIPAIVSAMMAGNEGWFRLPEQSEPSTREKLSSQMLSWHLQATFLLRDLDTVTAAEADVAIAALPSADEMMDEYLIDRRPIYFRQAWANACEACFQRPYRRAVWLS